VALGLETLDVAKIHDKVLAAVEGSSRDGVLRRAEIFFTEVIAPIEKTHDASLKANARLNRLREALDRRTASLARINRSLRRGVARRKTAEKNLGASSGQSKKLWEESRNLQRQLRQLAHRILSAQENKRKKISHELQDEIAQILVAINVRLLSLKKGATARAEDLRKEIASTRRLVNISVKRIRDLAREFSKPHET
jgi:signal transduction histidine kinase